MNARVASTIVLALAIGGVVYWFSQRSSTDDVVSPATAGSGVTAGSSRPPSRVTRIDPTVRKQLAERIARGQAARAAAGSSSSSGPSGSSVSQASGSAPSLERPPMSQDELDAMKTPLMDALQEVIPLMKECWQKTMPEMPDIDLRTAMYLSGDPDVGTLIDTQEVTEASGKPLPKAFDDCIQDTLLNLELPPLREGDKAKFTTRITFTTKDDGSSQK